MPWNTLLAKNNRVVSAPNVSVSQRVLPAAYTTGSAPDGVPVRIYTPGGVAGVLPAIVYLHGGGWVIGSLDVYEPSCLALASRTGAIVISVDYRLASETMNKFPAAHEDSYAAYKWTRDNAASLNVNPAKIAIAGESAGGNMAAAVCLLAKARSYPLPVHELLVYPVADNNLNTASYQQYANAVPLNKPNILYFTGLYFNSMADGDNALISLVDVADLKGLPPTTIIAAEIDPLQTEGQSLRDKLTAAGGKHRLHALPWHYPRVFRYLRRGAARQRRSEPRRRPPKGCVSISSTRSCRLWTLASRLRQSTLAACRPRRVNWAAFP